MSGAPEYISKYRITRALGKGAMGMVYEGFDPVIERRVAIKTILAEFLEADEMQEASARFKREAQAGGRLQHPGIIGVYEYGDVGDMAFIVMEYCDGKELKRILSDGVKFGLIEIFEIMKQLLGALDYSHKLGVVHRDIKPANLMITPGPKLKVMDFGIARIESSSLTQVGTVVGTPTHMSPEQLMGLTADGRADLWSSGVILYELLTGVSPFLADSPATVMHKVLQQEPDPPSALNPTLPKGFDAVMVRALAKKADERFQSAREFQAAMLQALQGKPVGSTATAMRTQRSAADTEARKSQLLAIDPAALAEIERSLSRHIGPLAKILIQRTQSEAQSVGQFFRTLAEQIPDSDEQKAFLKKMDAVKANLAAPVGTPSVEATAVTKPATTQTKAQAQTELTPEVLALAEKRLASYVGPLARVFIKQAAGQSGNIKELYKQLAAHIDEEDERRAFLESLPR